LRGRGESEQTNDELLTQRFEQRAVLAAEAAFDPIAAWLSVPIGDAHAARVVNQHADVVPLRHRG
jgi:hypothetical protein